MSADGSCLEGMKLRNAAAEKNKTVSRHSEGSQTISRRIAALGVDWFQRSVDGMILVDALLRQWIVDRMLALLDPPQEPPPRREPEVAFAPQQIIKFLKSRGRVDRRTEALASA
jgi:hypothetical protein